MRLLLHHHDHQLIIDPEVRFGVPSFVRFVFIEVYEVSFNSHLLFHLRWHGYCAELYAIACHDHVFVLDAGNRIFFIRNSIFRLGFELLNTVFNIAENPRDPLLQISG